ncbi:MAG TPA: S-methyl-5-thioribose-1-phosphate isomerase [Polyangiaceae bacterium]|jgi:methylthioribose-1-phosphate isomerase
MLVKGRPYRTIWLAEDGVSVEIIDQTRLPHDFEIVRLRAADDAARAIADMQVRGAPLVGAGAAYGMALAMNTDPGDANLERAHRMLIATRPTAINLRWAVDDMRGRLAPLPQGERFAAAYRRAAEICDQDVEICRALGRHGIGLIESCIARTGRVVNILTHCNAGWLATVDYGTALAPVYLAHDRGIPVHVWVDETRPRNQGASLTAWELLNHGVPHTVVTDNAGGYLMQSGQVDLCITGTDRTTSRGDACNKIGTYLKALAAHDCGIPFYVAVPSPSIDWTVWDGLAEIPIEQRDVREVSHVRGRTDDGATAEVCVLPSGSPVKNYGFDVTPARLVTAMITERGVCAASAEGLLSLFPEQRALVRRLPNEVALERK